ncbi:MAG: ComEC/Rec2 family competence protein, partial [Planctomycetota bacterium]|nr:ComEC/Rec2 family competence protein [Planctomycetota bacterium]
MRGTNTRKTQASGAQGPPRHGSTRLPGEHPGLTLAAAFAAGCHLGSALPVGSRLGLTAGAVLAVWLVMQSVFPKRPGGRWRGYVWVALFAAVGCLRGSAVHGERDAPEVFDRSPRRLRGRVDSVPIRRPPRSTLPGRASERLLFTLRLAGSRGVPESIAVAVDLPSGTSTPPPPAGALVELRGSFLPPRGPGNPGEVGSSSPLFFIPCPEGVRVLDPSAPSGWRGLLLGARERVQGLLHRLYSAEIRGLMISLLLGDRRLLSENIRHALTETGTYHFLAISGLHVGIFLVVLLRLPIPAGARTFGRLFALAAFSLLAGGATPVVRASLMAGLHLLLRRLGR